MMLHGIVFDMDGVIIDSHPAHRSAWKSFLASAGRETRDEELDFILDGRKREEILQHFFGNLAPEQIIEYGNRKDQLLRERGNGMKLIPGVVELLDQLAQTGIRTALATSASRRRVCGTLEELKLDQYFETVVTGDEVHAGKPDPAIYRLAAEHLQESPHHLLAVEDAASGVRSAKAAGMRCLGIARQERAMLLRAEGADPVIPDFRSISVDRLEACFH